MIADVIGAFVVGLIVGALIAADHYAEIYQKKGRGSNNAD